LHGLGPPLISRVSAKGGTFVLNGTYEKEARTAHHFGGTPGSDIITEG
jgi:hypothetical protein